MKKLVVLTLTLLMLVSLGIAFINRVEAAKPVKPVHKESVKSDDDRETDDDCDKCEQESKTAKIDKQNCEEKCEQEDNDSDQCDNDQEKDDD
jgi:hypothetical protein